MVDWMKSFFTKIFTDLFIKILMSTSVGASVVALVLGLLHFYVDEIIHYLNEQKMVIIYVIVILIISIFTNVYFLIKKFLDKKIKNFNKLSKDAQEFLIKKYENGNIRQFDEHSKFYKNAICYELIEEYYIKFYEQKQYGSYGPIDVYEITKDGNKQIQKNINRT